MNTEQKQINKEKQKKIKELKELIARQQAELAVLVREKEEEEPTITYETFTSQYDNDKVMLFKYDSKKYDYSDELYWSKDKGNYKYEWINLVIKEYKLEFGYNYWFDYKHQTDDAFMFWRQHSIKPKILADFKICSDGHLWKRKIDIENLKTKMIKVKSNIFA